MILSDYSAFVDWIVMINKLEFELNTSSIKNVNYNVYSKLLDILLVLYKYLSFKNISSILYLIDSIASYSKFKFFPSSYFIYA